MDPASPQRDALLRAPTLDLTLSPLPEVPDGKKQEEESDTKSEDSEDGEDSDVDSDVDCDVDKDVEEEEKSSDIEDKSKSQVDVDVVGDAKEEDWKRIREVREELGRRLVHEPTGPPPVCRVRTLCSRVAEDESELSFQPGSVITIHRLSEASEGWIVGTLDGKKGYVPANFVEILD